MVNQFVLEAHVYGQLDLYEENFKRSFVHVQDVVRAVMCVMEAPLEKVRNEVFNVGSEKLNLSKQEVVALVKGYYPQLEVNYRDVSLVGDMRSIHVSFEKMRRTLGFEARIGLVEGIEELAWMLRNRVIADPLNEKYRNHPPVLV